MRSRTQTHVAFSEVNWGTLKSLLPYMMEFRTRVALAMLCLIAAKIASVGLPFILKHVVDSLDAKGADAMLALPLGLLLAYGAVRFSNVLFGELRDTLFGRVTERAMRRLGLKVFKHLHHLDLEYHLGRQTGGISRDIERGTAGISFLMRFMVFNIGPTLLEIAMVMGLLWWNYHLGFALIVGVAVVLYVGFSVLATEWRTHFVREMNQAESESSSRAVDSLLNFETVKYFTNEAEEARLYDRGLAQWEMARRKNRLSLFALNGGQALIIAVAMTAALILAANDVINGSMTLGDFVLINAFMMQVFMPLNFLGFVYREMKGAMANIEKLFGLLDVQPRVVDSPDAGPLVPGPGRIEFEDVRFHYHSDRPILKGIGLTVEPRQKVAIVGSSGAGKSTLFKLLFRFYDVTGGAIRIDGQDIRHLTQHSLRQAIGVVPQDTVLFNTSILENVRYGRVDATDEEVWDVIRLAHLDEFVSRLPEGLQTRVGERGLKLSGGEKQRVAIARALLKRPPIMVFDEATSSLDSHSEKSILTALKEVAAEQTTLVIAHRLSTVIDADAIVVLKDGVVVEQGTHQALLALGGHYARLWALQQKQSDEM
ncbi:ABCB family ABC transporter ATP-binding protein/permease [Ferrimonas balearica]|uniref:ABCB family ABC transporter ATP-binding protein/permease n=1 Tax=Ferrimonas balearica TaxID=44012 RepID=UPI001C99AB0C|nr:ABC transporter ATP-binding protein/permease [Ferrimonas balearica]MBY5920497.1 ABC transporter ATP-binding protein/permease [Ferrimonas balearica]MBY5996818.1 ABC transporter ATP-binding protein/permease [Ferrimonas balearica]